MATVNLFKKVADYMKKHPHVSRKDAFAIVQGKKKAPAGKVGSKKVVSRSAKVKRVPSSPLVRQGAPVKVVKTTVKKKVSLGSVSPGKFALDKLNTEYKYLKQFEEKIEIAKTQVKTEKNPADKRAAQRSLDYYKELLRITKLNISNLKRSIR